MRLWPWQEKKEKRESVPFTDAIVAAIAAQAGGTEAGDVSGHWALETAAGLYARAFAGATYGSRRTYQGGGRAARPGAYRA